MKKIVLVDGNNLMFRSYYATAYSGSIMRNSKGIPTNALYGFVNMINKIIAEEKPSYMMVAFDIGKNFRKEKYDFYKEGRQQTPDDLKNQMPIARDILDAMGIKHLELCPYEADDIIGTVVKMCEKDKDFDATIVSSDKDLLQLINFETDIKLLKQSGFIRYNESSFKEEWGIDPINIIDLKALMGDSSDNIPGVKGIGEKGALKLLQEYKTLDGIYENIDNIKGALHDKLLNDKASAYMSYEIATIYKDVPLSIDLNDLKYEGANVNKLNEIFMELEFNSLLKNVNLKKEEDFKYIVVSDDVNVVLASDIALYIECDDELYTHSLVRSASIYDGKYMYYFSKDNLDKLLSSIKDKNITTYDHKKNLYFYDFKACDDLLIASYLLGYNVKEDISSLGLIFDTNIEDFNKQSKLSEDEYIKNICLKAKLIYNSKTVILDKIKEKDLEKLYREMEMPLTYVLSSMEKNGIKVDKDILLNQGNDISLRINEAQNKIYEFAGEKFNIASPKQLGDILFEKMALGKGKHNKNGYKTDADTLEKMRGTHEIIDYILEYRNLAKIKSTYIEGLINYIDLGVVHTTYKQAVARTGRLSSVEPNLQNIPVKEELGRCIRKAFIPQNDLFLSCDYSQIELRILAHIASCKSMIDSFNNNEDIHARVASDINGVDIKDVTPLMRKKAKSVIFGIVYGITSYGLKDNLHIDKKEADFFIDKYYKMYPEVKEYMESTIKSAYEKGFVKTLYNRIRYIDELNNSNFMVKKMGERIAINTPIQGTAADIIKMAMINVYNRFLKENIKSSLILQIHDELIFDVKKDELDKVKNIVKEEMENVIKLCVPLKVSSDTGGNWYETK